jgi:hypothetical protein
VKPAQGKEKKQNELEIIKGARYRKKRTEDRYLIFLKILIVILFFELVYINNMRGFHCGNSTHMYSVL